MSASPTVGFGFILCCTSSEAILRFAACMDSRSYASGSPSNASGPASQAHTGPDGEATAASIQKLGVATMRSIAREACSHASVADETRGKPAASPASHRRTYRFDETKSQLTIFQKASTYFGRALR
ncbi:MAG: hypothetical protein ACI835_002188 [Planctomycetota bacterium]|jgi:hypothetical protein